MYFFTLQQIRYLIRFLKCQIGLVENGSSYSCQAIQTYRDEELNKWIRHYLKNINRTIVDDFFRKLSETIQKLKLFDKLGNMCNMGEKEYRLTIHEQQIVLAKKGAKWVHLTAPEHI